MWIRFKRKNTNQLKGFICLFSVFRSIEKGSEVAVGLLLKDSETGQLFMRDRSIEIAKNLLQMGLDVEKISEATGLIKIEVEKLIVECSQNLQKK